MLGRRRSGPAHLVLLRREGRDRTTDHVPPHPPAPAPPRPAHRAPLHGRSLPRPPAPPPPRAPRPPRGAPAPRAPPPPPPLRTRGHFLDVGAVAGHPVNCGKLERRATGVLAARQQGHAAAQARVSGSGRGQRAVRWSPCFAARRWQRHRRPAGDRQYAPIGRRHVAHVAAVCITVDELPIDGAVGAGRAVDAAGVAARRRGGAHEMGYWAERAAPAAATLVPAPGVPAGRHPSWGGSQGTRQAAPAPAADAMAGDSWRAAPRRPVGSRPAQPLPVGADGDVQQPVGPEPDEFPACKTNERTKQKGTGGRLHQQG